MTIRRAQPSLPSRTGRSRPQPLRSPVFRVSSTSCLDLALAHFRGTTPLTWSRRCWPRPGPGRGGAPVSAGSPGPRGWRHRQDSRHRQAWGGPRTPTTASRRPSSCLSRSLLVLWLAVMVVPLVAHLQSGVAEYVQTLSVTRSGRRSSSSTWSSFTSHPQVLLFFTHHPT